MSATTTVIATVTPFKISPSLITIHSPPLPRLKLSQHVLCWVDFQALRPDLSNNDLHHTLSICKELLGSCGCAFI
jgi:hypothetical protein